MGYTATQQLQEECYCRQYSDWRNKLENTDKVVDPNGSLIKCQDIAADFGRYKDETGINIINYETYKNDIINNCRPCVKKQQSDDTSVYNANDCYEPALDQILNSSNQSMIRHNIRNEHNSYNKLAQKELQIFLKPRQTSDLLVNTNNNLEKNKKLNKKTLINKARNINTIKRMLLYDEETDRLYRVIIFILKFLLLIVSLITIKLIYDY